MWRIPHWQNILAQIVSQLAFWVLLLYGLVNGGGPGLIVGGAIGIVVGFSIALIPGFFSRLEALPET